MNRNVLSMVTPEYLVLFDRSSVSFEIRPRGMEFCLKIVWLSFWRDLWLFSVDGTVFPFNRLVVGASCGVKESVVRK